MDYNKLKEIPLFSNITVENLQKLLKCVNAHEKKYYAGEQIWLDHDDQLIGIVLSGKVSLQIDTYQGNISTLAILEYGNIFGETFVCAGEYNRTIHFEAAADSKILLLDYSRVFHSCTLVCSFHHRLIENIAIEIAKKNFMLMMREEILSQHTLREKILVYLHQLTSDSGIVKIPVNRNEMSYYLSSDRSALSRELSRMQKDGLIKIIDSKTIKLIKYNDC